MAIIFALVAFLAVGAWWLRGRPILVYAQVHGVQARWWQRASTVRNRINAVLFVRERAGTVAGTIATALLVSGVRDASVETVAPGHVLVRVRVAWWRRRAPVLRMVRTVMAQTTPVAVRLDVE